MMGEAPKVVSVEEAEAKLYELIGDAIRKAMAEGVTADEVIETVDRALALYTVRWPQ